MPGQKIRFNATSWFMKSNFNTVGQLEDVLKISSAPMGFALTRSNSIFCLLKNRKQLMQLHCSSYDDSRTVSINAVCDSYSNWEEIRPLWNLWIDGGVLLGYPEFIDSHSETAEAYSRKTNDEVDVILRGITRTNEKEFLRAFSLSDNVVWEDAWEKARKYVRGDFDSARTDVYAKFGITEISVHKDKRRELFEIVRGKNLYPDVADSFS